MNVFKGKYDSSVTYSPGDVVFKDDSCYLCVESGSDISDSRCFNRYGQDIGEILIMTYKEPLASGSFTEAVAAAPASGSASGKKGDYYIDSGHLYVCVAKDTWKRATLSTWTAS